MSGGRKSKAYSMLPYPYVVRVLLGGVTEPRGGTSILESITINSSIHRFLTSLAISEASGSSIDHLRTLYIHTPIHIQLLHTGIPPRVIVLPEALSGTLESSVKDC